MDISWLAGHARSEFHHSADPIDIDHDIDPSVPSSRHRRTLPELCRSVTPPCWLHPLLFNGHLQTCWTVLDKAKVPIFYKRRVFKAEDSAYAGSFAVDFVVDEFDGHDATLPPRTAHFVENDRDGGIDGPDPSCDARPMLVALHGLSGGSHELYLRLVLAPLIGKHGGWEACVVNARGCARSQVTSKVLFNARATWDVRQVVKWLRRRYPNRPLFAVGFSLGANILVNYLGEEGSDCILTAAAVCSNPWNLEISAAGLMRSTFGREVYSRVMAASLKELIYIHEDQVAQNTGVSLGRVFKTTYLPEFDREIQCPTWGYPTVGAYYRDASSIDSLLAVRIPLFAINARDDPLAANEALPIDEFRQNPYTVMCTTSAGGHLAWFESGGGRWFVKPMTAFLDEMANLAEWRRVKRVAAAAAAAAADVERNYGSRPSAKAEVAHFDPMRRKMCIDDGSGAVRASSFWDAIQVY